MSAAIEMMQQEFGGLTEQPKKSMVVILATGSEDEGKRATLAFSAACTALSMDKETQVFLVGEGAYWAYEGRAHGVQMTGFPPLEDLISMFLDLDGQIHVCSTCDQVCGVPSDAEAGDVVRRPTIKPRGMASVLSDLVTGSSVTF